MKRFFVIGIMLALFMSCSLDDGNNPEFETDFLPIESVDIPNEFELGEVYPITVFYLRPTTCHAFRNLYYAKENNERTVAIVSDKFIQDNCEVLEDNILEATFNFIVTSNGSYIFKFWQGEDDTGEDQYLTIEVPVLE